LSGGARSQRTRDFLQKLLLLAGSCAVALLTAEATLRISGKIFPASLFVADPDLGWSLRPGAEGWSLGEAKIYVKINAHGMRDRDHSIAKPPGTLRIAVLGDSYAEALGVESHEAFWAELERQAARCRRGDALVEVLNFGVSGFGTGQQLIQLRRRVWRFDPDIVLLAFYPGNDVFNNHRELNPGVSSEQSPYFWLDNSSLVLDESYRRLPRLQANAIRNQSSRAELINRIRLLQLAHKVINDWKTKSAQEAMPVADVEEKMLVPPTDPRMIEAWEVTEALIAQFQREVRERGAEFWLVVLSMRPQVHPDPAFRQALSKRLGIRTLDYPEQRIVALADRENFRVIPLRRTLAEYALRNNAYVNGGGDLPPGEGHWNALGHRLAGEHIAHDLCAKSEKLRHAMSDSSRATRR
jgi:hypothetical protein